ncbi:MAG: hypothetical protein CMO61_03120 [Verrucomicrobiales bacterium]|jgi:uncharacterized protein YbaR (Trm112 family)|nr:hypothetical protein [Verrucomicrobiales bacterium]
MSQHGLSHETSRLLRCPVTQQPLHFAEGDELSGFEAEFPEGAYLTKDRKRAYPVENGFLNLVPERGETSAG